MSVDALERMRAAFPSEAADLLNELDDGLLALEADPANTDYVHRVFRAIHTIKGSGSTAGFTHLAAVAHKVEEAFDMARAGRLAITTELVNCGLKACDVLREILAARDPGAVCPGEEAVFEALSALLPKSESRAQRNIAPPGPVHSHSARAAFEIVLRPHRALFYSGADPITHLDELRQLGQAHITAHCEDVPLFFDLEPESCYLWWDIKLVTDRGEAAIRDVFAFIEDDCDLSIRLIDDQSSAIALLGTISHEALELFAIECREHLEAVESAAMDLERNAKSRESLDAVFRSVHSIKGNAGLLLGQLSESPLAGGHPLPVLSRLAHAVESELDSYRERNGVPVSAASVSLVLEARDAMLGLIEALLGRSPDFVVPAHLAEKLALPNHAAPNQDPPETSAFRNTATQCLDVFDNCLRQLEAGQNTGPLLKTYQRALKTLSSAAAYRKRADLVEPVAVQLRILEAAMQTGEAITADDRARLRDSVHSTRSKIDAVATASTVADDKTAAPLPSARTAAPPASSNTIRIDQEKLDRLMRVVGELLVARGAFPTLAQRLAAGEDRSTVTRALKEAGAGISRITEELQASVMSIRMLPAKTVFQRFPRLVRDLAQTLGKEVQLIVEGESTELDKTILEQIGDPLVHLVRNAVDHGIERPEDRRRAGKPPVGRLTLRATNEAGNVLIQVLDDGRGLNPDALKRKAIDRGLITSEAASSMSFAEACRLVFLPGLSTAEKVTDVSGRGVGMDVVANNIRGLQGTVDIASTPGAGTVFSVKLPTSLIISKGILLEAGGQEYILPLTSIRDMVKVPLSDVHDYRGVKITQVRGEIYSVFSLAKIFGLPARPTDELPIAIIEAAKVRYGLIADRFISEVEVLVKPLAGGLEDCKEFHGAAIMGDGRVVLVLNPLECHQLATEARR